MQDFANIKVTREMKKSGPRAVFHITANLAGQSSMATAVDYLAKAFLGAVEQLGSQIDCPPEVVLLCYGIRPGEKQRSADLKAEVDRMWVRHPQVAKVMRQKGNGCPIWAVMFAEEKVGAFESYMSMETGPLDPFVNELITKVTTGGDKAGASGAAVTEKKPRWKFW